MDKTALDDGEKGKGMRDGKQKGRHFQNGERKLADIIPVIFLFFSEII